MSKVDLEERGGGMDLGRIKGGEIGSDVLMREESISSKNKAHEEEPEELDISWTFNIFKISTVGNDTI